MLSLLKSSIGDFVYYEMRNLDGESEKFYLKALQRFI